MKRFPVAFWVLVVGVAVNAAQLLLLLPLLPDPVASHFGMNGRADGFMSRSAFATVQWVMTAIIAGMLLAVPALLRVTPDDLINLPHKSYWFAPERRSQTVAYLGDRMYAFGAATLALLAATMQLVFVANIGGTLRLGNATWILLAVCLVYTAIWGYGLTRRFHRAG